MDTTDNIIKRLESRYEQRIKLIREVHHAAQEDPALARDLYDVIAPLVGKNGATPRSSGGENLNQADKVIQFFASNSNPWLTKKQIHTRSGAGEWAVHQALYRAGENLFDNRMNPSGGRGKEYRLTEAAYERYQQKGSQP